MSGKEVQFFLFNGIKLVKMHSDGKLIGDFFVTYFRCYK